MAYAPVTVTGYNATPPEDDGTAVATNEVEWQKHLDKIGAPLKTAIEDTQTAISAALDPLDTTLKAPASLPMLFQTSTAPTGWTKATTHNNKALRVVTGTASSGGSTAFTTVFASRTITVANMPAHTHTGPSHTHTGPSHTHTGGSHTHAAGTLSATGAGSHSHSLTGGGFVRINVTQNFLTGAGVALHTATTPNTDTQANHTHAIANSTAAGGTAAGGASGTGSTGASGTAATGSTGSGTGVDFAVQFVDLIIATKD